MADGQDPHISKNEHSLERGLAGSHQVQQSSPTTRSAERTSPYSSNSSLQSPILNANMDHSSSIYALQIALTSMKERYRKLQFKIGHLEDENHQLINGKSELFGEIGKMQENSIKLRERNLQLNQEVHSHHQECCSLKKKNTAFSQEKITLTHKLAKALQDNRRLSKRNYLVEQENDKLKDKIKQIAVQVQQLPGAAPVNNLNTILSSVSTYDNSPKTKIVPLSDELDSFDSPPSRFQYSDEVEFISDSEIMDVMSLPSIDDLDTKEEFCDASLGILNKRMKLLISQLHEQHKTLSIISPKLKFTDLEVNQVGQKDREMTTLTINSHIPEDLENCASRLATCGSVINPIISANIPLSPLAIESDGENNVLIEKCPSDGRPRSPFDWRHVQVSDEEFEENNFRPEMKNASTSPDITFKEEEKTCPMCSAVFSSIVSQEDFESHVVNHFEDESGGFVMLS